MEFRILGSLEVLDDNGRPVEVRGAEAGAVLALLLLHANQPVPAGALVGALWEDQPPASAPRALRAAVDSLREALGAPDGATRLAATPDGYQLRVAPGELDAERFREHLRQAHAARAGGELEAARGALGRALAQWRGPALVDFAADEFALQAAARLEDERLGAIEDAIDLRLGTDGQEAVDAAHAAEDEERLGERPPARARRATVTVLAAGLAEMVTPHAEPDRAHSPERRRRQHEVLTGLVRSEVTRHGGVVTSTLGGTLLAVFGLPAARGDDPERALRAALASCEAVAGARASHRARVGIATGAMIVPSPLDPAGDAPARDGGEAATRLAGGVVDLAAATRLAGGVVDLAAALLVSAPAGGILVARPTYLATRGAIEYRRSPDRAGWQPTGRRSRIGAVIADEHYRTALIGRDRELAHLAELLELARRERKPQLATIVGAPGIGKTRLLAELRRLADRDPELITWRQARCAPAAGAEASQGDALAALAETVTAQAGIGADDQPDVAAAKLSDAVAAAVAGEQDRAAVERRLRALLRLDGATGAVEAGPEEVFEAWARFFGALAAERPLVLALEDLHLADGALLGLVEGLAETVGPAPLLVVCTARTELLERHPGWGAGRPGQATLGLPALTEAGAADLADALLRAYEIELPPATRELLLARAAGNPLFLEEYVRLLRDAAAGPAAAAWLAPQLAIPDTVERLIGARIAVLWPGDRRVLDELAVVGELHRADDAAKASGVPKAQAEAALERLVSRELLCHVQVGGAAPGYAFRHALIREVAYRQRAKEERAERQRRTVESPRSDAATRPGGGGLGAVARADLPGPAQAVRRQASGRAAGAVFKSARPAEPGRLARPAGTADSPAEPASAEPATPAHGPPPDEPSLADALADARAATVIDAAIDTFMANDDEGAMALCEQAAELARAQGDVETEATARTFHAQCRTNLGDLSAIADVFEGLRAMEAVGARLVASARTRLAESLLRAGRLDECVEVARVAQRRAATAAPALSFWAGVPIAEVDLLIGRWEAVRAFTDRALARLGVPGTEFMTSMYRMLRGAVRLGRGDYNGALEDTRLATELASRAMDRPHLMDIVPTHARVLLAADHRDEAVAYVEEHLADLRSEPASGIATADLGIVLADLGYGAGDLPEGLVATPWLQAVLALLAGDPGRAAELYTALGAVLPEADARVRLGRQFAKEGRWEEARHELNRSIDIYQQAGATAYLREARDSLTPRPAR